MIKEIKLTDESLKHIDEDKRNFYVMIYPESLLVLRLCSYVFPNDLNGNYNGFGYKWIIFMHSDDKDPALNHYAHVIGETNQSPKKTVK